MKLYPKKSTKPLRAIRNFCFECHGLDRRYRSAPKPVESVSACPDTMCPLHDFRFGKNPFLKGNPAGNPEVLKQWKVSSKI